MKNQFRISEKNVEWLLEFTGELRVDTAITFLRARLTARDKGES